MSEQDCWWINFDKEADKDHHKLAESGALDEDLL